MTCCDEELYWGAVVAWRCQPREGGEAWTSPVSPVCPSAPAGPYFSVPPPGLCGPLQYNDVYINVHVYIGKKGAYMHMYMYMYVNWWQCV